MVIKTFLLKKDYEIDACEQRLKDIISNMGSVAVAFSGGVDSSLLLKVASDLLSERAVGITAISLTYPRNELDEAKQIASEIGVKHIVIDSAELENEDFVKNDERRCYYCKKELFSLLKRIANDLDLAWVLDGSNSDDVMDYRPGRDAAREEKVRSPFIEAGINKATIRLLAKKYHLSVWNKPAAACLSSRLPYGTSIKKERLEKIYLGELILKEAGFRHCRLRYHEEIARLELPAEDFPKIIMPQVRKKIISGLKQLGFHYISLDIEGYRTGSMNEIL